MAYYPFAVEAGAIYTLTNPNGAVAVFNDDLDPSYVGMLTEVTGLDSPEVRESADELVEADGGTHGNFYFGRRPIVMNGKVFGHASVTERSIRLDRARRASMALRSDSTLSWIPSKGLTNYVTNPRAVNDTSGWATTAISGITAGGTLTRVTAVAPPVGTTALQVVTTTTTNQGLFYTLNVTAGKTYYISVESRRTAGVGTPEAYFSGGGITGVLGALNTAGTFNLTKTFSVTPTQSGTAYLAFRDPSATANTFQVSDVSVTNRPATYFDGDSAGVYWQGDAHASTSGDYIGMFTTVRRQQPFRETGAWNKDFMLSLVSEYAPIFSTGLKTLSASGGSNIVTENRGSWPAYPILRITGTTAANPTITNSTTGAVINTQGTLIVASGETLEIDTLNHTANFTAGARNGQSGNRYINFGTTVWPSMPTGNNTYVMSGTGTLAVAWRDTWV